MADSRELPQPEGALLAGFTVSVKGETAEILAVLGPKAWIKWTSGPNKNKSDVFMTRELTFVRVGRSMEDTDG